MGPDKKTNKEKDKLKDAIKKALEAFVETPQGKKLKDLLLSKQVLPLTLMAIGTALTGILANKEDFPSIPEIEIWKKLKVSAEIKGNVNRLTGVTIKFSFPFGVPGKKTGPDQASKVVGVPFKIVVEIKKKINENAFRQWIIKQANWEYETAGPREEKDKRKFRDQVRHLARNPKEDWDLPILRNIAMSLAANLYQSAKSKKLEVTIKLVDENAWPNITDRTGVFNHLQHAARVVVSVMKDDVGTVKRIIFVIVPGIKDHRGKEISRTKNATYPILVERLKGKA